MYPEFRNLLPISCPNECSLGLSPTYGYVHFDTYLELPIAMQSVLSDAAGL